MNKGQILEGRRVRVDMSGSKQRSQTFDKYHNKIGRFEARINDEYARISVDGKHVPFAFKYSELRSVPEERHD